MLCRVLIACALLSIGACRQVADVGGAGLPEAGCANDCRPIDAATATDAGVPRPGPYVPSADASTYSAFTSELNGLWHGVSAALDQGEETLGSRFEITFAIMPGDSKGTFLVTCIEEASCDPFGFDSALAGGGNVLITDLVLESGASANGKLSWPTRFAGPNEMPFWSMQRDTSSTGAVLTFNGGYRDTAPYSRVAYRVVLAEGAWPDAGGRPSVDPARDDAGTSGAFRDSGVAAEGGAP